MASGKNGTLYIGVTAPLIKRVYEHKSKFVEGFTEKYKVDKLVHFEEFDNPLEAIKREKNIKAWKRGWKLELIEKNNPELKDLYDDLI